MGPVGFREPSGWPMGFRGSIKMTLGNQYVEDQRPFLFLFFFWDWRIFCYWRRFFLIEDLFFDWRPFFGDHIKILRKLCHFPRLFWSSQNWRCLIFELISGTCLALGAFEAWFWLQITFPVWAYVFGFRLVLVSPVSTLACLLQQTSILFVQLLLRQKIRIDNYATSTRALRSTDHQTGLTSNNWKAGRTYRTIGKLVELTEQNVTNTSEKYNSGTKICEDQKKDHRVKQAESWLSQK